MTGVPRSSRRRENPWIRGGSRGVESRSHGHIPRGSRRREASARRSEWLRRRAARPRAGRGRGGRGDVRHFATPGRSPHVTPVRAPRHWPVAGHCRHSLAPLPEPGGQPGATGQPGGLGGATWRGRRAAETARPVRFGRSRQVGAQPGGTRRERHSARPVDVAAGPGRPPAGDGKGVHTIDALRKIVTPPQSSGRETLTAAGQWGTPRWEKNRRSERRSERFRRSGPYHQVDAPRRLMVALPSRRQ